MWAGQLSIVYYPPGRLYLVAVRASVCARPGRFGNARRSSALPKPAILSGLGLGLFLRWG